MNGLWMILLACLIAGMCCGCKKSTAAAETQSPVNTAPALWPINGMKLMIYDVTKTKYPAQGSPQRFERAKTIERDRKDPHQAAVLTTDDYQPVMTEYFSQVNDEVRWIAFASKNQPKCVIDPLVLFKASFVGGEEAGESEKLHLGVIGWEEVSLTRQTVRACKLQISLMVENENTFSGFRRIIWMHDQLGVVKEEKMLYRKGEMVEKESSLLRQWE
jgi:hypothetical protein